jgi:hypothetical protein
VTCLLFGVAMKLLALLLIIYPVKTLT